MTETNRPTCDLDGCDNHGYARYRHVKTDEWIDTCFKHAPTSSRGNTTVSHSSIYLHTVKSAAYPAETPAEVRRPNSISHREKNNE